jgi:hypothetical protein
VEFPGIPVLMIDPDQKDIFSSFDLLDKPAVDAVAPAV